MYKNDFFESWDILNQSHLMIPFWWFLMKWSWPNNFQILKSYLTPTYIILPDKKIWLVNFWWPLLKQGLSFLFTQGAEVGV